MRASFRPACLVVLVALSACVRDPGLGPDLGACADYPDNVYTYGEVGIGDCLAGPTDLRFLDIGGESYLAVVNADPFRLFTSGSLLLIPENELQLSDRRVRMDELGARSLPLDSFVGRIGYDPFRRLAMIPGRLSAESFLETAEDLVWMVDLSDPMNPQFLEERRALGVRQDPFAIAFDARARRAYVVNALDHSISIIDTSAPVPALLDPAPASILTEPVFEDADGSGSIAELRLTLEEGEDVAITDSWEALWLESFVRAWLPVGPDLRRWTSDGGGNWSPDPEPFDLVGSDSDLGVEARDPWPTLRQDALTLWFEDQGNIVAASTGGLAAQWTFDDTVALRAEPGSWRADVGAPSVLTVGERNLMYFHGREAEGGPASIGVATSTDTFTYNAGSAPLLAPEGVESFEHPSAMVDPLHDRLRLWFGRWDGTTWCVAHSASADGGSTFDVPEDVLCAPGGHAAAPAVRYTGGRYQMVLSVSDGFAWTHAESWSWDGLIWSDPVPFANAEVDFDLATPPRVGLFADPTLAWRIQGEETGPLSLPVLAGFEITSSTARFTASAASGHRVGTDVLSGASARGVEPSTLLELGGRETLYVTATDAAERPRIASLVRLGDRWAASNPQIIAEDAGGNADGVRNPVVYEIDGTFHLLYGAIDGDLTTLRHATSPDGFTFTPSEALPLPVVEGWDRIEQLPGSIERLDDGTFRLWYAGFDGTRFRIGSATSADGAVWNRETGLGDPWQLDAGRPGEFDDSGVRDPKVFVDADGNATMFYSGFDDQVWRLGAAVRLPSGAWERTTSRIDDDPIPVLPAIDRTFATLGTRSAALLPDGNGGFSGYFGGFDGDSWRIGSVHGDELGLFPEIAFPTIGDRFSFTTRRGQAGRSNIELGQIIDGLSLPGAGGALIPDGPTAAVLDDERGFLFVVAKSVNGVWVIDVRDDSTADFEDLNYLDIEAFMRIETTTGLLGVQDAVLGSGGRMYLAAREPDAIVVIDTNDIVDDATKEILDDRALTALGVHDLTDDAGELTFAAVGAAGLALVPGQDLLLATHFRDNSVSVFDLSLGAFGEEIRYERFVGENPHVVRVSPDGTYAVIADYLGTVSDDEAGSALAIMDLRPDSPTWLEITKRVVNR
jgi:hypothetical protein